MRCASRRLTGDLTMAEYANEYALLCKQARKVIAGAGLRGITSLKRREAILWLAAGRPIKAMQTVGSWKQ
jgi:hypothetical protein